MKKIDQREEKRRRNEEYAAKYRSSNNKQARKAARKARLALMYERLEAAYDGADRLAVKR